MLMIWAPRSPDVLVSLRSAKDVGQARETVQIVPAAPANQASPVRVTQAAAAPGSPAAGCYEAEVLPAAELPPPLPMWVQW
jgi:hypothetical protein